MNKQDRDIDILRHIVKYCNDIAATQAFFGASFETFRDNAIYRNAIAMCILQIGELSGYLTDRFKETYSGVPWRNIKGMRNIMAHKYGDIDVNIIWEAIKDDVPMLREYCMDILDKEEQLSQE